jgi:ATP-dependent Clp protease protease subunit
MSRIRKDNEDEEILEIKKDEKYGEDYYFKILNKSRYILLYDEINNCVADVVVSKIKAMNLLNQHDTITLEINSPGGDVSCGFSIINAIEQSKAPIITVISGQACSMAAMIFIVGKRRKMYYNSYAMFHPLSEGQADYLNYIKDRTRFLIELEKSMDKLCKKYTKFNNLDMHKMNAGELWISAEVAIRKGICDEIIK